MPYPYDKENNDCLNNGLPGEPIFVLRAKDALAPGIVQRWAIDAYAAGVDDAKIRDAYAVTAAMEEWAEKHGNKLPD